MVGVYPKMRRDGCLNLREQVVGGFGYVLTSTNQILATAPIVVYRLENLLQLMLEFATRTTPRKNTVYIK